MPDSPQARERPMPVVKSGCFRCGMTPAEIEVGNCIVSPTGKAHFFADYGTTACGLDATGDKWWWPL